MDVPTFFCAWRYVYDFCSRFFLRKSAPASRKHLHMRSISSFLLHAPQYLHQCFLLIRHIHWISLAHNVSCSSWILALYLLNLRWPEISNKVLGLSARCTWGSVRSVRFGCVRRVSALLITFRVRSVENESALCHGMTGKKKLSFACAVPGTSEQRNILRIQGSHSLWIYSILYILENIPAINI
jgi:hypothetical protein